jgi:ABC transporter family protein
LPQGYDTIVGERGVKLSGEQRQRLSVARAFLHDPRILLLDEPTSSVEPEREALIRDSLEELSESRRSATSLFISATPRPTAVNRCELRPSRRRVREGRPGIAGELRIAYAHGFPCCRISKYEISQQVCCSKWQTGLALTLADRMPIPILLILFLVRGRT